VLAVSLLAVEKPLEISTCPLGSAACLSKNLFFHWFNNNEWERIQELNLDYMAKKDMTEMIEGVNIL
jgi:hypothetical protein